MTEEKKAEEFSWLVCPDCGGWGYTEKGKCQSCKTLGMGIFYQGYFLYWDKKINTVRILQRKIEKFVNLFINILLLILGVGGLLALGWETYSLGFVDIFTIDFWQRESGYLLLFWISILADMYIYYRLERMSELKTDIIKKEFEEEPLVSPENWQDILNLKNKFRIDISQSYTSDGIEAIEKAWKLAKSLNHESVMPIHLLAVLPVYMDVSIILGRLGINAEDFKAKVKSALSKLMPSKKSPVLSLETRRILFEAYKSASEAKQKAVDVSDLLEAIGVTKLGKKQNTLAQEVLYELEIDAQKIRNVVQWIRIKNMLRKAWRKYRKTARLKPKSAAGRAMTAVATPFLDSFSEDLTLQAKYGYLTPCIGRDKEIDEIFRVIKGSKKSVILVGNPGVGKTTIIGGIAQRMVEEDVPDLLKDKRLVSLSVSKLVSGASAAKAEERLMMIFNEVTRAGNIVLAIDKVHDMIGISAGKEESLDLSEVLAQGLSKGIFFAITTTNTSDYSEHVEKTALGDVLQKIKIDEVDTNGAIQILEAKSGSIEFENKVYFSYDAIERAVVLSHRFIPERYLPEKAIDILKEIAVKVSNERGKNAVVTGDDVTQLISERTNIPLTEVTKEESKKLLGLEDQIHKRMINQDEAVKMVSSALRRARAELRSQERPIVNLLFLGPTGVGKTELAKTVADIYFGSEKRMIRLDMSEYQDKTSLHRLIGNPAEKTGGYLTEAVRKSPFSLLLLDEIEKAHPDILNIFLQVMDDGRLTDSAGLTIDFTNVILIATSNAGAYFIQDKVRENTPIEDIKEQLIEKELKPHFRPEFLNRFDGIIVFKPLGMEEVKKIARLMLKKVEKRLEEKGINFEITDEAVAELAKQGFDPEFGARPLRRVIQEKVDDTLANYILSDKLGRRDTIIFKAGGEIEVKKAVGL